MSEHSRIRLVRGETAGKIPISRSVAPSREKTRRDELPPWTGLIGRTGRDGAQEFSVYNGGTHLGWLYPQNDGRWRIRSSFAPGTVEFETRNEALSALLGDREPIPPR